MTNHYEILGFYMYTYFFSYLFIVGRYNEQQLVNIILSHSSPVTILYFFQIIRVLTLLKGNIHS